MDYASLIAPKSTVGSLQDRVNYAKLPSADLVQNAQDEIFARLRVREMRKGLSLTVAAGALSAPLPADYVDTDVLLAPSGAKIKRVADDQLLYRRATSTGQAAPQFHGIFDGAYQFDSMPVMAPGQVFTITGMYYGSTYISSANPTSYLTQKYSSFFWAVLLKVAYAYRKDWPAVDKYTAQVEDLFKQFEATNDTSYAALDDDDAGGFDFPTLIGDMTQSGSLASWVGDGKIPSRKLIMDAQNEIFSRLRVREMRKSLPLALAVGASSAPLPADYLDMISIFDLYSSKVKRVSDDRLMAARAYDSTGALIQSYPTVYGVFDGALQFDCAMIQPTTLNGLYYAPVYLGLAQPTSFLTTRYSQLFRAMLNKHAFGYKQAWDPAKANDAAAMAQFEQIEMSDDFSYRDLDDGDQEFRL